MCRAGITITGSRARDIQMIGEAVAVAVSVAGDEGVPQMYTEQA